MSQRPVTNLANTINNIEITAKTTLAKQMQIILTLLMYYQV